MNNLRFIVNSLDKQTFSAYNCNIFLPIILTHVLGAFRMFCLRNKIICYALLAKVVNEYDQEIPQSQTLDRPMALRGRVTQQS